MLLSDIDPVLIKWIDCFIPLFSGIAKILVLSTVLVLLRIMDNAFSRLIDRISRT